MKKKVDKELLKICNEIKNENLSLDELIACESCDRFQTEHYCGGFDSLEMAFCFSYYESDEEYYFQITREEVDKIISGEKIEITLFADI